MYLVIDEQWEPQNESRTLLLCGGRLSDGTHFHVEAVKVKKHRGIQVGHDECAEVALCAMENINGGDGAFHTIKIPGYPGKWVLNILPGKD